MKKSLCCIWLSDDIEIKFKTLTYKSFSNLPKNIALNKISNIAIHNFKASQKIIKLCKYHSISGYRMSSSLIPLITHPDINLKIENLPYFEILEQEIKTFGKLANDLNIRVSSHPGEFISLTSNNSQTIQNSLNDLELHGKIFDIANFEQSHKHPLNIHIRQNGNKQELFNIFSNNYNRLSNSVKKRLVLENNDTGDCWGVKNLVEYFYNSDLKLPITFDNLHHKFLSEGLSEKEAFHMAYNTWDYEPIFHYSEGINNTRGHADYANNFQKYIDSLDKPVMLDIELKMKNLAIQKL